ncbi:unnamed protein product [Cylicocyclus nassatus]|uniref:Uncharacterized protein n=1 Tax=Cylicocyclus nassatus TaxID=53992 RepID=A0AA36M459_CYLNA|nr:unnamed protein product [Cylicocyclus nassatus]
MDPKKVEALAKLAQFRPEDKPQPHTSVPGPLKPIVNILLKEEPRFTEATFTDRVRVQLYSVKDIITGKKVETPHTFKCGSEIYTAREDAFAFTEITVEPGKTVEVDVSLEDQVNFYPQQKIIIYDVWFYGEGIVIQPLPSVNKQTFWQRMLWGK